MVKRISRSLAIAIALALFMTTIMYAFAVPVHAASKPDLKKANISWDLKNNKSVKFKTKWYALGV